MDFSLVWKTLTFLHRVLTSTQSNTYGMKCEPDLITQNQRWTALMLLWLNGSKSQQPGPNIWWKVFPAEWRVLQQQKYTYKLLQRVR